MMLEPLIASATMWSWQANPEDNILGYRVYFREVVNMATHPRTECYDVGNVTAFDLPSDNYLSDGAWLVSVSAYNVIGLEGARCPPWTLDVGETPTTTITIQPMTSTDGVNWVEVSDPFTFTIPTDGTQLFKARLSISP